MEHDTCSTLCWTPIPGILNHENLTRWTGGVWEDQNMEMGHILTFPDPLATQSNFYESKWLVQMSVSSYHQFYVQLAILVVS